ncbi:glycosyltransferase family 2 protein [Arthrobacter sp. QXT-31]|uniref:glycosyltransferase family 2 protein n=1 Tax=Arthrobacter sp. QXT-31 TaxID=1357915 RepID=UPI000971A54D|nr:glycosyltransferase family 2 protein [Arthrobacter sp. QXT-31]APX04471.1 glycosyl transferase [Arthrobacter sp. QXT-31]
MDRHTSASWASSQTISDAALDVLIPTCNRPAELAVTLAGLAAQDGPAFRVVVSDQSDGPPAWEHPPAATLLRVLRAQGTTVELHRHLPRRGLAEHRQFVLEQARTDKVLFLDDDVWLEPGALSRMGDALDTLGCGFVGMAPQGLSYLGDRRPEETITFSPWQGPVTPERIRPGEEGFQRWPLHSAANLSHVSADLGLEPGEWLPYKVAWLGGCTMFRRQALEDAGGFRFWPQLPAEHCGEDVVAQWRVMEKFGGAGILPSGAVHLESPTTVTDRRVEAFDVVLAENGTTQQLAERY